MQAQNNLINESELTRITREIDKWASFVTEDGYPVKPIFDLTSELITCHGKDSAEVIGFFKHALRDYSGFALDYAVLAIGKLNLTNLKTDLISLKKGVLQRNPSSWTGGQHYLE